MLFVSCLTAASVHARNSLFFFTAFRLIGTPLFPSSPRYAINPPCPTFVSVYITVILGTPPFSSTPRYAINPHSTAGPRYAPVSVQSSVRHSFRSCAERRACAADDVTSSVTFTAADDVAGCATKLDVDDAVEDEVDGADRGATNLHRQKTAYDAMKLTAREWRSRDHD